jgi:hypothetical protein
MTYFYYNIHYYTTLQDWTACDQTSGFMISYNIFSSCATWAPFLYVTDFIMCSYR